MKIIVGDKFKEIELPAIDGSIFNSDTVVGKPFMLSFFRFATCPFCNLRIHELVKQFDEFGDDFAIVAIFDSPIAHLTKHAEGHQAPFHILADEENQYYREYGVEHSVIGMLKGAITRIPTLLKGLSRGYIPIIIKGRMTTMPADLLIDSEGVVQVAYYGKDEGDHLLIDEIVTFSNL